MKNSIFKNYTKKILRSEAFVSVIIVFVLALGIIGTSYSLYMDVDEDTNYQLVEVGDLSISFETPDGIISLENMVPMEDENAITDSTNVFSFYIYNTGSYTIDYDINLIPDIRQTDEEGNALTPNTVDANYINYQICRDNANNCAEIKTLGVKNEDGTITINNPIYTDSLLAKRSSDRSNPSAYYFLRLWINNTYESETAGTIKYKVEVSSKNASGYLDTTKTLAGTILNNAKLAEEGEATDKTIYSPEPLSKPAKEISGENERTLSQTQDDYGTSYYYRGNVTDNYVNFADMCWRIVRIQGDGSIKLILEDQDNLCAESDGNWGIPTTTGGTKFTGNFGYTKFEAEIFVAPNGTTNSGVIYVTNYLKNETDNTTSMATAFKNFQSTFNNTELEKMSSGTWCYADKGYIHDTLNNKKIYTPISNDEVLNNQAILKQVYFDSYIRLSDDTVNEPNATLKCNGTIMENFNNTTKMFVSTLTADEMIYAGGNYGVLNAAYYLINSSSKYFWSISPATTIDVFIMKDNGEINQAVGGSNGLISNNNYFRPAIILKSGVLYSTGDGLKTSPYEIK